VSDDHAYPPALLTSARAFVFAPEMRPLLAWLLERTDVSGSSGTAYREGERAVGRDFLDLLEVTDPTLLVRLAEIRAGALIRQRATPEDGT
jgi:hypothetical protein